MALNRKILRGSAILTLNEVLSNGCAFIRSSILARVLSKGDNGVAATLTVTFLFVEFIGKMAFGQQIITSKNATDRKFVDTAHSVQFGLGMISAALLLLLARPLAAILGVPELTSGMQLLALVPACMAMVNLGGFTYAREMHFERSVSLEIIPQALTTLIAWPVAIWLKDFRAFIWLQIIKAALASLVSYFVAGRPYTFAFRKDYCLEIFRFSWPLMISGFIMLCSSQGDRLLMTHSYDLAQLGTYGVAWLLASTPSFALLKIVGGTALPVLAKTSGNYTAFRTQYALVSQLFSLMGALFAVGMVVAGEEIIVLLYGHKYAGAGLLLAWLSCGHAVRMVRGAPTGVAWGSGETRSQMIGNVVRLSGLLLVIPVILLPMFKHPEIVEMGDPRMMTFPMIVMKGSLTAIAAAGLIGEIFALLSAVFAVRKLHRMEARLCLVPLLTGASCVAVSALVTHWLLPHRSYGLTAAILAAALGITLLIFAKAFPELGGEMRKLRTAAETRLAQLA